jgi:cytochrome c
MMGDGTMLLSRPRASWPDLFRPSTSFRAIEQVMEGARRLALQNPLRLAPILVVLSAGPATAVDAERGRVVFQACAACHSERPDAIGPSLRGVFGRKSAALEDFRYSNPMKRADLTWDEANLRDYVIDPQAKVKGNRMPYGGLRDQNDVDDLIAYLKILR